MAWSISITAEGWEGILAALENWSEEALREAISDDRFEKMESRRCECEDDDCICGHEDLTNEEMSARSWEGLHDLPHDVLVQVAYDLVQENNTCDNGGWYYWIDKEGYHTVRPYTRCDECYGYFPDGEIVEMPRFKRLCLDCAPEED